jgi:hypothetical protein
MSPGYIYIISNPLWPGYSKVGRARRVSDRLRNYQTYSPHRDYRLNHSIPVQDRYLAEAVAHRHLAGYRVLGTEWFVIDPTDAFTLIHPHLKET